MAELGAVFLPQFPPERLREVVTAAEAAGLAELWLWEDCFLESGIATASAALAWTERMRVGVGLLPVPLRNVALTAMEISTLDRLFPGRLRVGIGHGVQDWMGQVGARVESPMTLLGEYLDALRRLLAGERVTCSGRYVRLDGVKLDWPPHEPTKILMGGIGQKTIRLAGAASDGVILTGGTTPEQVAQVRATIGATPITVYLQCVIGEGALDRLEAERVRWRYETSADRIITGDAESIAREVRRWADAGAGTIVLQPPYNEPDPVGFVRFVSQDVASAL